MENKKYYFLYIFSILIICFVWIGPTIQTYEVEVELLSKDGVIVYAITPEEDEPEKKFWIYLKNTNEIITFMVGFVNVYFIVKHIKKRIRKKNNEDVDVPKRPTRFSRLLRRLFNIN